MSEDGKCIAERGVDFLEDEGLRRRIVDFVLFFVKETELDEGLIGFLFENLFRPWCRTIQHIPLINWNELCMLCIFAAKMQDDVCYEKWTDFRQCLKSDKRLTMFYSRKRMKRIELYLIRDVFGGTLPLNLKLKQASF